MHKDEEVAEKEAVTEPKSSKKKRKDASVSTSKEEAATTEQPKSAKKSKTISTVSPSNEDANFIASKKFIGAKKGYVFKKSKLGIGYYTDVLPVVDKVWLSTLGKSGGGGGGGARGGGGRKSMGHSIQRKKGGRSRKSY